jgi:hypothetical protein
MTHPAVAACAQAREEAAKPKVMTIAQAVDHAAFLERIQDGIVAPDTARAAIRTLLAALQASPCYYKAVLKGEEVFVLRQQDRAAPHAISEWAQWAEQHGCSPAKVDSARTKASRWISQAIDTTKWPD